MIPKIVHQIYWNFHVKNGSMPTSWQKLSEDCRNTYENAGWKYCLWGKKESDHFITNNFPWMRRKWLFSTNIEKVDILRYAIMYIHGGMYLDLDTKCVNLYTPNQADIILGGTALAKIPILSSFYGINNNILLSVPNHPFWLHVLHRINIYNISDIWPSFIRIGMYTGPYCLQYVYDNYPDKNRIIVERELSVAKIPNKNTYFLHDSAKSWVSIGDSIHMGIFISILPLFFKLKLFLTKKYWIICFVFIIILTLLLCGKNLSTK
jgi:mannosyltransferase OCH1-like enzyme